MYAMVTLAVVAVALVGGGARAQFGYGKLLSPIGFFGGNIGGLGGGIGGGGLGGGGLGFGGLHGFGGEEIDKKAYGGSKKALEDEKFEKVHGKKGEEFNKGNAGFQEGKVLFKDAKGQHGYYGDAEGGKKLHEDGKQYYGGQHFGKEGKEGEAKKENQGHKKGHVIKGFKTSHQKDEHGKTEEYYDEANDEGDRKVFKGEQGEFGEKGQSAFKGAHEDGKFAKGEKKKDGHYGQEHLVGREGASKGQFGEQKYGEDGKAFGANSGAGLASVGGHHGSEKLYKHRPFLGFY